MGLKQSDYRRGRTKTDKKFRKNVRHDRAESMTAQRDRKRAKAEIRRDYS
jgi:hypothetical protein